MCLIRESGAYEGRCLAPPIVTNIFSPIWKVNHFTRCIYVYINNAIEPVGIFVERCLSRPRTVRWICSGSPFFPNCAHAFIRLGITDQIKKIYIYIDPPAKLIEELSTREPFDEECHRLNRPKPNFSLQFISTLKYWFFFSFRYF